MNKKTTESHDRLVKALLKPDYRTMTTLYDQWWLGDRHKDSSTRIPFFEKHGWTWLEYVRETARINKTKFKI